VVTKNELDMIKRLKELGIDSIEKLNKFFDVEGIAADVKELLLQKP
jgi:hypothetical protein